MRFCTSSVLVLDTDFLFFGDGMYAFTGDGGSDLFNGDVSALQ